MLLWCSFRKLIWQIPPRRGEGGYSHLKHYIDYLRSYWWFWVFPLAAWLPPLGSPALRDLIPTPPLLGPRRGPRVCRNPFFAFPGRGFMIFRRMILLFLNKLSAWMPISSSNTQAFENLFSIALLEQRMCSESLSKCFTFCLLNRVDCLWASASNNIHSLIFPNWCSGVKRGLMVFLFSSLIMLARIASPVPKLFWIPAMKLSLIVVAASAGREISGFILGTLMDSVFFGIRLLSWIFFNSLESDWHNRDLFIASANEPLISGPAFCTSKPALNW